MCSMPALPTGYAPNTGWVTLPAIDDIPTNDPPPAATSAGTECFSVSMVPTTLSSSTRRNSSTSWRWYGPIPPPPPALATTPRKAPVAAVAWATAAATSSSTVTSATVHRTGGPDVIDAAAAPSV